VVKDNQSDIIGEFQLQLLRQWKLSAGLQWNPNDSRTERGQMQIQYNPDSRHILNLSYRYRRDILDQVDASLLWQLTPSWSAVGRLNYSFDDKTTLESFAGFEYDSCCWAVRFVAREYINRNNGASNRSFYLQMEFKGLGAVGKPVEELLEHGILGYHQNP
ncbi:MAG: LPS assembly protein LptD, partial [Gammaproteobacteria bacterium]